MQEVRARRTKQSDTATDSSPAKQVDTQHNRAIQSRWRIYAMVLCSTAVVLSALFFSFRTIPGLRYTVHPTESSFTMHTTTRKTRYKMPEKTIAIGDLHGDFEVLHRLLHKLELIDEDHDWIGGATTVVQTGDQQDRGSQEQAIYDLLFKLQDQATAAGGAVHILLGNHDIMNAKLDFRYVTQGGFQDLVAAPSSQVPQAVQEKIYQLEQFKQPRAWAVAPGGKLARQMAMRMRVSVIVGDKVFVHGGLSITHLNGFGYKALEQLNTETSEFLLGYRPLPSILDSSKGPVWMRTYSKGDPVEDGFECTLLANTLQELDSSAMIMGHTVQLKLGINSRCNRQAWRIDTGMSYAYGGRPEALVLYSNGDIRIVTDDSILTGEQRSF